MERNGRAGDSCEKATGVVCRGRRVECQFVRGYPQDGMHCVARVLGRGRGCVVGNNGVKVFRKCREGLNCVAAKGERVGVCK